MKYFKSIFIFTAIILLITFFYSCQNNTDNKGPTAKPKLKVAFVYVGPVGDAGWTLAHDNARKDLEKYLGELVETASIESVPEGADAERIFTKLCEEGYKLIFGTSFGYMDAMENVAKRYPHVVFEHCSGYKTSTNLGTYFGKIEQPRYLSGLVAGKMTKSNKIGYVAAHPIPEVIRGINAFTLGVRKVNPRATVQVVWTYTWYDPAKEKEAAESLLDMGSDVIAQHQDTPGPQQAAEGKGCYSIGYNSDMSSFAPKAHLTSPVWNWSPFYMKTAREVYEDKWKSSSYCGGMKDGIVDLAPLGPMVP
ncbi:MAG TPA: BMP family ABC transporter substrate-binding protein, partial [Candidatus Eremiobacteraeota bacterium]|nr:BMP family ABC transporter substrate-binding protein [Candidatus Eremiobacteraeota bacterium]